MKWESERMHNTLPVSNIVGVVPGAFTSEHIETLYEPDLDNLNGEDAHQEVPAQSSPHPALFHQEVLIWSLREDNSVWRYII
jgi:protoheme ferro-lyase